MPLSRPEEKLHIDSRNSSSNSNTFSGLEPNDYRGFSTDAPPEAVNTYSTTSEAQQWGIIVEEDSVVGIVGQD